MTQDVRVGGQTRYQTCGPALFRRSVKKKVNEGLSRAESFWLPNHGQTRPSQERIYGAHVGCDAIERIFTHSEPEDPPTPKVGLSLQDLRPYSGPPRRGVGSCIREAPVLLTTFKTRILVSFTVLTTSCFECRRTAGQLDSSTVGQREGYPPSMVVISSCFNANQHHNADLNPKP